MAASQFNRYIWLVDTIRSAGRISRQEIDRRWSISTLNENHENVLPERTFFRYRNAIEELFGIEILCDRGAGGLYYIADTGFRSRTKEWLLSQFALQNSLQESHQLEGRIIYEDIPQGTQYLTVFSESMRSNRIIKMVYQPFDADQASEVLMAPYCMKVFKQRWYVLGDTRLKTKTGWVEKGVRLYALDRIKSIEILDEIFQLPVHFDAQDYFKGFYGVFRGNHYKPQLIKAQVSEAAAPYLRSLPLHASQEEEKPCLFTWYVAPTYDFIQQLRTFGSDLEVLSPQSLRDEFVSETLRLNRMY